MEQKQSETVSTPPPVDGPGAMLKRAREDLRLAPDNVASILRLSARQIQSLESDDYSSLPGATYVRGYLRSYAQLLGLSPDKVIDIYQQYMRQFAPPPPAENGSPPGGSGPGKGKSTDKFSADQTAIWTVAGVALVVLVLGILWWKGRDDAGLAARQPGQPATYVTESGAVIRDPAATPSASETAPVAPVAVDPVPVKPAPPPNAPAPPVPAVKAPVPAKPVAAKPVVQPAPATGTPAPAAVASPSPAPAATPAPAAVRGRLVLRAMQETWADVRDGRQGRLLYETLAPGRVVTLEGVAPFSVFLGNAEGVQVEFNGQPVDVARHKRGAVARFTLGDEKPAAR